MMKQSFASPNGAPPVGPYSPAVKAGPLVFVSGQGGMDAEGRMPADVAGQAEGALRNVQEVLAAAGAGLRDVVKSTVFLKDMNDFATVNQVYARFFEAPYPARSCVEVARLPKDMLVEIEVVAVVE